VAIVELLVHDIEYSYMNIRARKNSDGATHDLSIRDRPKAVDSQYVRVTWSLKLINHTQIFHVYLQRDKFHI